MWHSWVYLRSNSSYPGAIDPADQLHSLYDILRLWTIGCLWSNVLFTCRCLLKLHIMILRQFELGCELVNLILNVLRYWLFQLFNFPLVEHQSYWVVVGSDGCVHCQLKYHLAIGDSIPHNNNNNQSISSENISHIVDIPNVSIIYLCSIILSTSYSIVWQLLTDNCNESRLL